MGVNWGKILDDLVEKLVELFVPWAIKTIGEVIEGAYKMVEAWAEKQGNKPTGEAKMAAAVALVQMAEPIAGAEARMLLEAHHIKTTRSEVGKTAVVP